MDVIDELIAYCEAWEPWARVMGNVCAGDAAQALRSLRAELAEAKKPDCRTCTHYYEMEDDCYLHRRATPIVCINGDAYVIHGEPVRLYEIDTAMAGGE